MTHPIPLPAPQKLQARFRVGELAYEVKVSIPDLRGNPFECWGDWGPMYTVTLKGDQRFIAVYSDPARRLQATYSLRPKTVRLHSPVLASEREQHPLYLEFDDEPRGLRFRAYLSPQGQVVRLQVHPMLEYSYFDELLFPFGDNQRASA